MEIFNTKIANFEVLESGVRYTDFGNSSGGGWDGFYRYFHLKRESERYDVISISVMGGMKYTNDRKEGNRKGSSFILVAIDNENTSHLSLQLNIDRNIKITDYEYEIWHSGKMTNGNKGSVKNSVVIDYIKQHKPELVVENKIFLGSFPKTNEIVWEDVNTKNVVKNLIDYALLRDELRQELRK